MPSIVDEYMHRFGSILPAYHGVNFARAGGRYWHREPPETERQFLARVRREAAGDGFSLVEIAGAIETNTVTPLHPDHPGDSAA